MISKGILGTKGTTEQIFNDQGNRIPVTRISTDPCYIVGVKTESNDGYWAVQLAFGESKHIRKSAQGLFEKAGIKAPLRFLREVRFDVAEELNQDTKKGLKVADYELWVGQTLKPSELFNVGEKIVVTGISKGKGFQGVVKRHGFAGGKRTHGQSDRERAPGSIGSGTTIGRVFKGKKMAGRMGSDTVTIRNLEIVEVTDTYLLVKGLLPGIPGGLIVVRSSGPLPEKPIETVVTESTDDQVAAEAYEPVQVEEVADQSAPEETVESKEAEEEHGEEQAQNKEETV